MRVGWRGESAKFRRREGVEEEEVVTMVEHEETEDEDEMEDEG